MAFSVQKHWEIVFLHLHRLGPKLSIRSIAKELQCSQDTVQKWINQYQETGDVQDQQKSGRKRKTSEREDTNIVSIAKRLRTSSSAEISISVNRQGTNISSRIVRCQLNEQGLYKLKPLLKPLLSDTHQHNQLKWAKANRNNDFSNVIFTDETTITQFSKPKKVWRKKVK